MIQGSFEVAQGTVEQAVQWLRLGVEAVGALMVAIGVVIAMGAFIRAIARRLHPAHAVTGYTGVRLTLARYLGLALEFQLASDILSTAIAPSWDAIGKLGAIAVIRTVLNYFLSKEMSLEAKELEPQRQADEEARQTRRAT